ncbi:MAG: hypothetical protein WC451_05510 [Patescibacteria group bacterium]
MAQALSSPLAKGFGAGISMAGIGYEGAQTRNYYGMMAAQTQQQKERAQREINIQRMEAGFAKDQAKAYEQEAVYSEQIGAVKEKRFQKESDQQAKSVYSKMAKSGVSMSYGSPMEVMEDAVNQRSEDLAILGWSNKHDTYQKEMAAKVMSDKATIMLSRVKMAEADLPMYDWQSSIYGNYSSEVKKATSIRQFNAFLGAYNEIFKGQVK